MSYLSKQSERQQPHACGWPSQFCALAAAATIGLLWWHIPVSDELDDIGLLSAIALLGFGIVVMGMAIGHFTPHGGSQQQVGSLLFLRRLVPAVVSRSRRRPRHQV